MKIKPSVPALLGALCLQLLVPLLTSPVRADIYQWAGGATGDFDSANWYDATTGYTSNMDGPPGGGDTAIINGPAILSGSGNVDMLDTSSTQGGGINGTFSCNVVDDVLLTGGTLTAGTIGPVTGALSGFITVSGGQLTAGSVASGFGADFSVSGGGSVIISSTLSTGEGNVSGQGSTLTINGALMNFNGGPSAGGTLTASSIQSNNGSDAMTQADGAGSLVTTPGNAEYDGQGISVTNGAEAAIGGNLLLYPDPTFVGGGGQGYFDGSGSKATVSGTVTVSPGPSGGAGSYCGFITISDGASLNTGGLYADSGVNGGFVTMSNGGILQVGSQGLIIGGLYPNAYLSMETSCGLTLTGAPAVAIGFEKGSSGTVSLDDSSYLNATGALIALGKDAGSSGTLSLSDSSTMQLTGSGAYLHVGDAGSGNLQVFSGSTLQVAANVPFEMGSEAGSGGSAYVTSTNGLTLSGPATIGNQGTGQLTIATDPTLSTNTATASASGSFFVGGNGSLEASTGNGMVSVNLGGQLALTGGPSQFVGLGNGKGAVGEIYVDGSGSALKFSGPVLVGALGSGELAADQGATAQSAGLQLATDAGSIGQLLVYNSGTVWTESNFVVVGGGTTGGSGGVAVLDSGLLRIYRKLSISNKGVADLTKRLPSSTAFPAPASPAASAPPGRIFVGSDNFGPDGAIRVGTGGVLTGKGKQVGTSVVHTNVIGNVVIGLGGTFQPGGDPDVFSIEGDCDLSDSGAAKGGGETDIEVAGTDTAGTDYDQIVSTGKVTLGGTLKLVLLPGYKPQVGDTLEPIKAKTMAAGFKEVVSPGLTFYHEASGGKLSVKVMSVADVPAPDITSEKTAKATVGESFTYQIKATGLPAGYNATGLPDGLDIDTATGRISGTPTAAGVSSVDLSSTSVGGTGKETLKLTVEPAAVVGAPVITSLASATGKEDVAFSYQITGTNMPTSFGATGLPAGLHLDVATGLISGKPTKAGKFTVMLSATNVSGTDSAALTLTIAAKTPVVTLAATTPTVTIGSGKSGVFTVKLSAVQTSPVTVNYTIKGSAMNGTDYVLLTGTKKIKVGKISATIDVTPKGDLEGAASKVVTLKLEKGTGYTIGTTTPVKVTILKGD